MATSMVKPAAMDRAMHVLSRHLAQQIDEYNRRVWVHG
jgi:hypothetical protein